MTQFIDLSHDIVAGMTTYPGLPAPHITTHISREESGERLGSGVSFHIGRVDMVANTGTYIDSPWHFHEDGVDLAGLALERLADLPLTVVRRTPQAPPGIEVDVLPAHSIAGHTRCCSIPDGTVTGVPTAMARAHPSSPKASSPPSSNAKWRWPASTR